MAIVRESALETGWASSEMQELLRALLEKYTSAGDIVLDPFCGTGAIPALADRMGRRGYCCDFSQKYVKIAKNNGVQRVHRCNAANLNAYQDHSVDLIITSPPTLTHKEKYDIDEPDINAVIRDFLKEAKRILKKERIIIIGVREDAEKYHALCKKSGLKLTFIALPMSMDALEGFR